MRYGEFTYELFSIIMEVSNEKTKENLAIANTPTTGSIKTGYGE